MEGSPITYAQYTRQHLALASNILFLNLLFQFSDMHELLLKLAIDAGVQVDFNAEVVGVDPSQPCVTLTTGEKIGADIIVGADGSFSAIRRIIMDDIDDYNPGAFTVYTYVFMFDFIEP